MTLTETITETNKILILTLSQKKRVTWHESVVDNEHMNKRKSNKCCIFHKKQELSDSSCEESSDSDSD